MKVGRPFFCGEFDERIKPAKSFYGSHAIARTFLEMPRGSSANAKTFFFRFAELPQTPKHIPRDLREYPQTPRQTPRDLREYPQTPKHFPRDLREYPQTPKHFPRDLREYPQTPRQIPGDLREYPQTPKHFPGDLRDFRGAFPKALWPLTARDQRHSPGIRESILSSNSRCLRDHPFPIGHSMQNAFEVPSPIRNGIFRAYSLRLPVIF